MEIFKSFLLRAGIVFKKSQYRHFNNRVATTTFYENVIGTLTFTIR